VTDVVPLFATLSSGTRPFGEALPATATKPAPSPWSPKVDAAPAVDETAQRLALEKAKRDAAEQGRAEGLRETEALRGKLRQLVTELEKSREVRTDRYAEAIADAAVTSIEAWIGKYDRAALFQPIIRAWIAAAGGATAAVARVNPADATAMKLAIGDVPIRIEPDAKLAAGDVELRGDALDTTHVWRDRLAELRDAIATAIETSGSAGPRSAPEGERGVSIEQEATAP
jgi:flagellar biosynthesis/type III secretory pathway protein FliH